MAEKLDERQIILACALAIGALGNGVVIDELFGLQPEESCTPETRELLDSTRRLLDQHAEAREFIGALAKGDIIVEPPRKNQLVAPFKQLHSSLHHLVWQIQQVADGNYNLRVDFLGRFSDAFNRMVVALAEKKRIEMALSASEARSLRAENVAKAGHWELHLVDGSIHGSPGAYKIYGLEGQTVSLDDVQSLALPQYRPVLDSALLRLVEADEPFDVQYRIRNPATGELVDIHAIAEFDRGERIVFAVIQDITERKRAEELLDYQHRFQKMIADVSADFINTSTPVELDARIDRLLQRAGEFFAVDRAYLFQFSADGKRMTNTHEWCATGVQPEIVNMQDLVIDDFPWWAAQIRKNENVYIPDVELLPLEASVEKAEFQRQGIQTILCVPICADNQVTGLFGFDSVCSKRRWDEDQIESFKVVANIVSNALQKHHLEQELLRSAINDQLTGLYNRRHLHKCLPALVEEYKRTQAPFAVAFFDIDHFKKFNDTYGHVAGDFILQQFALMLKENIRPFDIACRYGGEEFLVLARGANNETALVIAERILDQARKSVFDFDGQSLRFTLSCGVADCTELDKEPLVAEDLIDRADRRLYLAKQGGRNQCVFRDAALHQYL